MGVGEPHGETGKWKIEIWGSVVEVFGIIHIFAPPNLFGISNLFGIWNLLFGIFDLGY
jgi:hypothetical protein